MQKYKKFLVLLWLVQIGHLAIWLVEKYCFVLARNVKKTNVKFGVNKRIFLTAKNRL